MDRSVGDLLKQKGTAVLTVSRDSTVIEAVRLMNQEGVGSLVVTDDDQKPIGIISERDVLQKVVDPGLSAEVTKVDDAMLSPAVTVSPKLTAVEAMRMMTDRRIRHLPVVTDDKMVGIISIGDVMKTITESLEHDIEQLESYITGSVSMA
jgi:CBS domain-containing protein